MSTEPKRNAIVDNIVAALQTISIENGFWNDIQEKNVVDYFVPLNNEPSPDFPFICVVDGDAECVRKSAQRKDREIMDIDITIYVAKERLYVRRELNRAIQDVRIKILADPTRSALAESTTVEGIITDHGYLAYDGQAAGVITARVIYAYPWTQP